MIFAGKPVLFFSDLISGPKTGWEGSATKGAAVTVWGKDLGPARDEDLCMGNINGYGNVGIGEGDNIHDAYIYYLNDTFTTAHTAQP